MESPSNGLPGGTRLEGVASRWRHIFLRCGTIGRSGLTSETTENGKLMVVPLASAQKETRMSTLLRNVQAQFLIPVDDNNCFWSEEDGQE